jgi:hypothetical protein
MHRENKEDNDTMIQKYLLSVDDLKNDDGFTKKKPILWIHLEYTYNARHWESFGSRSSYALNQPYLYLTLRSIIRHCDESFHICLIDDKAFKRLLPDWKIDMTRLADPVRHMKRQIALAKIVHKYGGMHIPASFLCMRDLREMYDHGTMFDRMFVVENIDRNASSVHHDFAACMCILGAQKECPTLGKLIAYMEKTSAYDYTEESRFLGRFSKWCEDHGVFVVDGRMVGVKTEDGSQILVDHLLNMHSIAFCHDMYGILIPSKEILNRTNYEWFARLSEKQIAESNTILCKYITGINKAYFEGFYQPKKVEDNGWVSFWKVPSSAPVWGLRPDHLGNYVPKM